MNHAIQNIKVIKWIKGRKLSETPKWIIDFKISIEWNESLLEKYQENEMNHAEKNIIKNKWINPLKISRWKNESTNRKYHCE